MTKQKRNVTGFFRLRRQNDEHGGRDDMVKEYLTGLRRQNDGREAGMTLLFHFD